MTPKHFFTGEKLRARRTLDEADVDLIVNNLRRGISLPPKIIIRGRVMEYVGGTSGSAWKDLGPASDEDFSNTVVGT